MLVSSHKMNYLLKAMGFWIWGLIAIAISVSLVSVSYRTISAYRPHQAADATSRDTASGGPQDTGTFAGVMPMPRVADGRTASSSQPFISKIIGKDMIAAQKAMQAGQWPEALRNLEAAKSKSPLTNYDEKSIQEFTGVAKIRLNDYKAAQTAYEAALATGIYKTEELGGIFRLLFQLAAVNKQDTKAIGYGTQSAERGAATDNDLMIMSQLYYQQKDCLNSGIWGDKAVAAFKDAGEPPKEVLYQLKLQCASNVNDTSGMKAALYDLIRLTNKTSYWNNLLRLERQDEHDEHNTLMIYRVMFDTHSMNADTDYIEMAQLLGDAGLAGEAQTVLVKAMSSGILKDEHKERTTRLLAALQARADSDKNGLSALDAEAGTNPAGQLDMKLGEVYFGVGDYQSAATALSRGIGKGQLSQPDEAYVSLGRSLMAEKDPAGAKQVLAKLNSLPNISPRVLKLWGLYADMLPGTASEPL
jgi:tetratricopeptide (TPR) repeat protein